MNIETLTFVLVTFANCALYFALGVMWRYRQECRRAGNM
jgi:hypothetical protein